jgi:uncharacterized protein YjbI with pentapeptide repeats
MRKGYPLKYYQPEMSNPEHLGKLLEGVEAWKQWRNSSPFIKPDLSGANLRKAYLNGANLSEVNLSGADLGGAELSGANLSGANLSGAELSGANLRKAYLNGADLSGACLREANLNGANLYGANLRKAYLNGANLSEANLREAYLRKVDLSGANLREANLREADLSGANLREAHLSRALLVETNLEESDLTGCTVYGISVWNARLDGAKQSSLIITREEEPAIQVDNLEVAQFVYLLLNNARIRHVIDTITSKVVLILGRFKDERKVVLDAIRDELRKRDYVPVLFDFEKPASKDRTGTISTLANMARFIIADLTDPSSVPHELATVVPGTIVPVQAILLEGQREYAMFPDLVRRYRWVLEPYQYKSSQLLLEQLNEGVIAPAEVKAKELTQK